MTYSSIRRGPAWRRSRLRRVFGAVLESTVSTVSQLLSEPLGHIHTQASSRVCISCVARIGTLESRRLDTIAIIQHSRCNPYTLALSPMLRRDPGSDQYSDGSGHSISNWKP
ncbi:hypothetical protein FIBSPDRAFT_566496 [Athelia psychrophila]|uniref:Uncharacterized protein n=1 Tax=Athelia psychrophila TaxID=1759441 RepID=A0A166HYT2_9AGAM|nr:hypothetical protein FIBSPDRAFT_566496 [Fibularhizoctonia sp. CBS 109695]